MTFEKDTVVLERDPRLRTKLLALSAVIVAATLAQMILIGPVPFGLAFLMFPLGIWNRAASDNRYARPSEARVRLSVEGAAIDGQLRVPAITIAEAVIQPRTGRTPTVRLLDKDRSVILDIIVADEREGAAMLSVLGRDAGSKKARFATMNPIMDSPRVMGGIMSLVMAACSTSSPTS